MTTFGPKRFVHPGPFVSNMEGNNAARRTPLNASRKELVGHVRSAKGNDLPVDEGHWH